MELWHSRHSRHPCGCFGRLDIAALGPSRILLKDMLQRESLLMWFFSIKEDLGWGNEDKMDQLRFNYIISNFVWWIKNSSWSWPDRILLLPFNSNLSLDQPQSHSETKLPPPGKWGFKPLSHRVGSNEWIHENNWSNSYQEAYNTLIPLPTLPCRQS